MTIEEYWYFHDEAEIIAKHIFAKRQLMNDSRAKDEAHDAITDMFVKGDDEAWCNATKEDREKMILNRLRSRLQNAARKLWTNQGRIESRPISVDEAPKGDFTEDGDEENIESTLLSDEGSGAEAIRSFEEIDRLPDYVYMVRDEVSKLGGINRKIARMLLKGLSLTKISERLNIHKVLFWEKIKNLRPHFAQCLQAYRAFSQNKK